MKLNIFNSMVVLCVLVLSETASCGRSESLTQTAHVRVKRGKYYNGPPQKFYRRPPFSFPVSGAFSYTPPPGYMMDDEEPQHPGNQRPYKVSKRAPSSQHHEGLGDDDINNIIKYLSKKDLDKIVQMVGNKMKFADSFNNDIFGQASRPDKREESPQSNPQEVNAAPQYSLNNPYIKHPDGKTFDYNPNNYIDTKSNQHSYGSSAAKLFNGPEYSGYKNEPLHTEESMQSNQLAFLNSHIESEIWNENDTGVKQESLPNPENLRESDGYEVAFTKNVPSVVKAEGYKVEDFSGLPLMDYHSKLHTVSSYKVPHYTVTSPRPALTANVPPRSPPIEPAPPASEAHSQSDAHLKAIKIWTHKSKGTAYTLNDDGTLTLEVPRPRYGQL